MKALITGASSGIGYEIAKYLNELGHELILVARSKEGLEKLQKELIGENRIIDLDLANEESCWRIR